MIWIFTCLTTDCENNLNPVYLVDPTNPVLCGSCRKFSDAVETNETVPEEL
jgi:predicted molibdopterin-dependent oxidoreductase YjgC